MRKKPSIIRRLLLLSGIVAMIPVVTSILYFQFVIGERLSRQAETAVDSIAQQVGQTVVANMTTLNNISYYLMANDLAQQVMNDGNAPLLSGSLEKQIDTMMTYNDAWSSRIIQSLFLYRDDGAVFATTREGIYAGVRERNRAVAQNNPGFSSTRTLLRPTGSPYSYYLQDYYQIDIQRKLGKLIIEVDPARLVGEATIKGLPDGSQLFLVGEDSQVLYAQGENVNTLGHDLAWAKVQDAPDSHYYQVHLPLGRYRMSLHLLAPYAGILQPVTASRTAYILVQTAVFGLMIALIFVIAARMQPHSRQLVSRMERLAEGDFSVSIPPSRYQEYDVTARAFNQATKRLGSLFARVQETGNLLSQAEYQVLESQINPHFIMNVLETINMRCRLAGQKETAELVVSLGSLLGSNVRTKHRQQVTLFEELDYVRYYLALQKARFTHLDSSMEVEDDALYQCLMPKLTLQPLVENCFVHGLEDSQVQGRVSIRCWEENGLLLLQVKDNGKGFDPSHWLRAAENPPNGNGRSGIALYNINRRVQLLYGPEFGLQVDSAPGEGTTVWVSLPLTMAKEGDRDA